MMNVKRNLVQREVSIFGSDSITWIELTVHPSSIPSNATYPREPFAPLTKDVGYGHSDHLLDPRPHIIWRIHKSLPHVLEVLELSVGKEFPRFGLRILFPDALSPFAFICLSVLGRAEGRPYLLQVLTVTGFAYSIRLNDVNAYGSPSIILEDDLMVLDLRTCIHQGVVTSAAADDYFFVVGTSMGSVFIFRFSLDPRGNLVLHYELRDDNAISWGLTQRSHIIGAVQDLVITQFLGGLAFVLHSDGTLRVWELHDQRRVLSHKLHVPSSSGTLFKRLWICGPVCRMFTMPLAILHQENFEDSTEIISVYGLHFNMSGARSLDPSVEHIRLAGEWLDIKLSSDYESFYILILQNNGLVSHKIFQTTSPREESQFYALQEEFVADQMFQSSDCFPENFLWIAQSMFSYVKEQTIQFVSSIFLRELLHPSIFNDGAFRMAMLDFDRDLAESELYSLSVDGLKKKILSLIEQEVNRTPLSVLCRWKAFCSCYFDHWCKNNAPLGLLPEFSTGAVVLIRKNSIALFRSMEKIELHVVGPDEPNGKILSEVLDCVNRINEQMGKTTSSVIYESLISSPLTTFDDAIPCLMKILQTGYKSSRASLDTSDSQSGSVYHKRLRKFYVNMILSLQTLREAGWPNVLDAIKGYIDLLVPPNSMKEFDPEKSLDINTLILVHSTAQVARVMFDTATHILLFLNYLIEIGPQVDTSPDDVSRIQFELVPVLTEIMFEWLIVNFFASVPCESPAVEAFSNLPPQTIDVSIHRLSRKDRHRTLTLACVLLAKGPNYSAKYLELTEGYLPGPQHNSAAVWDFISWITGGRSGGTCLISKSHELAMILLKNEQYNAVEFLIGSMESHIRSKYRSRSWHDASGKMSVLHHLLGCCHLCQTRGLDGIMKNDKVYEAARCFFRASSGEGAFQALQRLSEETGFTQLDLSHNVSAGSWKLQYYQWAMQAFALENISEVARQFALAALEQVDGSIGDAPEEPASTVKGRLWTNVFKFSLDLNQYDGAYSAIISNPDEDSKYICLRHLITVLYDHGALKILCNGQLPLIGLAEKVEHELSLKAERSEIMSKQNPYKLLYAFEAHRHNWRAAAKYMYRYTCRLRNEAAYGQKIVQERLNGLSAAINALNLVHPLHAWIDPLPQEIPAKDEHYAGRKAKATVAEQTMDNGLQRSGLHSYLGIEELEKEFILTSAEHLLCSASIKWSYSNALAFPQDLVNLLVQRDLYDMAFTVLLKFCEGSGLKSELERVFMAMSLKCRIGRNNFRTQGSTSSKEETSSNWENLKLYLGKYENVHGRLPIVVAATLLQADSEIELPVWLVNMFKRGGSERRWGMAGQESNPGSLFQLYVDHGRLDKATNLLLEHITSFNSVTPAERILWKRPSSVWFPYKAVERLWCQLETLIASGHMVEQSERLRSTLQGPLSGLLEQLKMDSDDAVSSLKK